MTADPKTAFSARQSPNKIVQISAMQNGCFALCANGRVYVCVYDGIIDEWVWSETCHTPGVRAEALT